MSTEMDEIISIFIEEAASSIEELEKMFLELSVDADAAAFKAVFRIAHNIKGSAKSVGMINMGRLTHELETLLIKLADGKVVPNQPMFGVLLSAVDGLKGLLDQVKASGRDDGNIDGILASILSVQSDTPPEENPSGARSAHEGDIIFMDVVQPETAVQTGSLPEARAPGRKLGGETVRVPTFRIDRLQNHVGEILVLQSVLFEQLRDHPSPLVRNALRQMKKVTREVQEDSMGLRLVSLKNLFLKLTRAVHDAASALGKDVGFVTVGEDTEVDKVLSEGLADPLMHMVRNAVDHGQEAPEERERMGNVAGLG